MRNFIKVAAAAAILAGSSAIHAMPYVTLTITDYNVTDSVIGTQIGCSTFSAATVGLCAVNFTSGNFPVPLAAGDNTIGVANLTVGAFKIVSSTAESNTPGTTAEAFQNRSQTSASRKDLGDGKVHRLLVDFVAYGFTDPNGPLKSLSASAGMTANIGSFSATDKLTSVFSVDENNALAFTASLGCTLTVTTSPLNESCGLGPVMWVDSNSPASLFSMRSQQIFDMAVGSAINSTANSSVRMPEPMSTALVGIALFGLALTSRRRAGKQV